METKRPYLLTRAHRFELEAQSCYDEAQQLNLVLQAGRKYPLVMDDRFARTESKTMQAPGDDDPDPEDLECY